MPAVDNERHEVQQLVPVSGMYGRVPVASVWHVVAHQTQDDRFKQAAAGWSGGAGALGRGAWGAGALGRAARW